MIKLHLLLGFLLIFFHLCFASCFEDGGFCGHSVLLGFLAADEELLTHSQSLVLTSLILKADKFTVRGM